jgi:hypothetical protein
MSSNDAFGRLMKSSAAVDAESAQKKRRKNKDEKGPKKTRATISPSSRKRKLREPVTNFVNAVKARKCAALAEFGGKDETLTILEERNGLLFCLPCNKNIRFRKKSDVRQHFEGARKKGKDGGQSQKLSHAENVKAARESLQKKSLVEQAVLQNKRNVFEQVEAKLAGHTLSESVLADRAAVLEDFFVLGIPTAKLANKRLIQLIEQPHADLGGRTQVEDMFPIVKKMQIDRVKAAVDGRNVSIFFDASKVNFLVEAVMCRYLTNDFMPCQICVGVAAVPKSVNSASLRALLRRHLTEAGIELKYVVGAISDSGPPNPSAMKDWNAEASDMYHGEELKDETLFWIPCLMHAFSNIGTVLRKRLPLAKQFMKGFKRMVNTSDAARKLWMEVCGSPCPGLAEKSFWAWWDCAKKILDVWQHVKRFLQLAFGRKLAEKSVRSMKSVCDDDASFRMLTAELNFALIAGKTFHDGGFILEGDGFCAPYAKRFLSMIQRLFLEWTNTGKDHVSITSVVNTARLNGLMQGDCNRLVDRFHLALVAMKQQADAAIFSRMADVLPFFSAAGLFCPHRLVEMSKRAEFAQSFDESVRVFAGLKGLRVQNLGTLLTSELPEMLKLSSARIAEDYFDSPAELWLWWRRIREKVPTWFSVACLLVLLQPTSAVIERFFSLVKANTSGQQGAVAEDTFAIRCMCLFNCS